MSPAVFANAAKGMSRPLDTTIRVALSGYAEVAHGQAGISLSPPCRRPTMTASCRCASHVPAHGRAGGAESLAFHLVAGDTTIQSCWRVSSGLPSDTACKIPADLTRGGKGEKKKKKPCYRWRASMREHTHVNRRCPPHDKDGEIALCR